MKQTRVKVGIVGCGAIGSRIAKAVKHELKHECELSGLYDINAQKSTQLSKKFQSPKLIKHSLDDLIKSCDLMVEAVTSKDTDTIIRKALQHKKNVLVMSVGRLLGKTASLFNLAKRNKCALLIPSGAIAGIDAIKAASQRGIKKVTLTSCKPPKGFRDNPYLHKKGIHLDKIKKETVLFQGGVQDAVKYFPQNINVAATLNLALQSKAKLLIKIITSPKFKNNSHEIRLDGDFGSLVTRTDNVVCPDNPKTSYLAVLSGIQTLKQYCSGILVGT